MRQKKSTTNEITSSTMTSSIVVENEEYVLYYTYLTNPKSKFIKGNPIQYSTCKIILKSKAELHETYWTTQQTIGDIFIIIEGDIKNGNYSCNWWMRNKRL